MQWTDDVRIETPEQIDVSLEVAGLGSRFVAQSLDWVIKAAVAVSVLTLSLFVAGLLGLETTAEGAALRFGLLFVGFVFGFALAYDVYYEVKRNGQTPGKWFAGIRVIRDGGTPIDFRSACVRNLLGLVDCQPGVTYLFGALLVLVSKRGQRLGDMAAGTVVIRERSLRAPADLARDVAPLASDAITFTASQCAACSPADRPILRSFFERRGDMEPEARKQLTRRLAEQFAKKTSYALPEPFRDTRQAVTFLASLYRDLEAHARHDR